MDDTRTRLAKARTVRGALTAIALANVGLLREIEAEYSFLPGPVATLRERIAAAQVTRYRAREAQMGDTTAVTAALVRRWARDTLVEWMAGYSDFRAEEGGQYRMRPIPGQPSSDEALDVIIEVATVAGTHRRHFQISVDVVEL